MTIFYAFLIYKFTGIFVWTSVILTGVGIFAIAYMLQRHNRKNKGSVKAANSSGSSKDYKPDDKNQQYIQYTVYGLYGLGVIFFIALCCLWKNIAIAIAVL